MTAELTNNREPQRINRRHLVWIFVGFPLVVALCMFLPAGTWTWKKGWLFTFVFAAAFAFIFVLLLRVNPEVVYARSHPHQGTKHWDKVLLWFFFPSYIAIVPLAALDDGRFHWHPVPWWVCGIGYVLLLVGMGIATWAEAVNKFFEVTVRIQTDRGQTVIQTGPYAVVRHPGYLGSLFTVVGTALALGSLWALLPAGIASFLMILRTQWEDQTLRAELNGYAEYTHRVRYKLIPGVW